MAKITKRMKAITAQVDRNKSYPLANALEIITWAALE